MNRSQALTIAVIFAFFILGLIGVMVLLVFPYNRVFVPTPTITLTPSVTPTPTIERFLPTGQPPTPTQGIPTPVSTRVPTITPRSAQMAAPTVGLVLPTPRVRPSATPSAAPTVWIQTATPTATLIGERQYVINFSATKTVIDKGECIQLEWRADGPVSLQLDNRAVKNVGQQKVCPQRSIDYILKIQMEGSAQIDQRSLHITVK